ncbi:MAG: PQQ-dependent sugar dehydrogenase [Alphaproteobacteria bacterium]|nr:PQQ-dependent sugar dehydrogenase [Alphaproteobacteria bacterium]
MKRLPIKTNALSLAFVAGILLSGPGAAAAPGEVVARIGQEAIVRTVAEGLDVPWGMAFLPDGRMLVSERPGRLRIVHRDGRLSAPLTGVPEVHARGQGGLLDVALDPDFARTRLVYLSFAEPGPGGAGTAVARGRLGEAGLEATQVIFRQQPKVGGGLHFGSRLAFSRDGYLFITTGERYQRDRAQQLDNHFGKLIRIWPDGTVPPDNPFVGRSDALPEIYSYGHRNMQGATLHPDTGRLWIHEHGARGGDEINLPEPGRNYGWPVITYGVDYSGLKIGIGTHAPGMEQPVHYWDPSIAPSGMAFYTGEALRGWKGNLFIGSINSPALYRLEVDGTRIVRQERLLADLGEQIRDVRNGPDGFLYLLTDNRNGRVLRIEPAR